MAFYVHQFFYHLGFWFSWLLIPIVVEIIPAIHGVWVIRRSEKKRVAMTKPIRKWPMLSVVLPVHNSGNTLYQCIDSINASNYPKHLIQIINVNNKSTDNSFDVYKQAKLDFPDLRMQWMNTDQGKARALNAAIFNCTGQYVINLDTDGFLEPEALRNLVLYFENNPGIDAATGTVLTQKQVVANTKNKWLKLLRHNEYFEYAQAFLVGRSIENHWNQLFTLSGAFSAFRRNALTQTFMYNVETVSEDTEMTFQLRFRFGKRIGFAVNSIFYVDPISGCDELYLQRQRWQRGELEVIQKFMQDRLNLRQFFSNFIISRLMIDHTFIFPRLAWIVGLLVLLYFGYSPLVILMSILTLYVLYVVYGLINYASAIRLLRGIPEERHYLSRKWWVAFTMPYYNALNTLIRFIGILNTVSKQASWQTDHFKDELAEIKKIFYSDLKINKRKGKVD